MNYADFLSKELPNNIVRVVFTKTDGTERVMLCTLKEDIVPKFESTKTGTPRRRSTETMSVWDVEADGWRSFRLDSIKEATIHNK